MLRRYLVIVVILVVVVLAAVGCGSAAPSATSATGGWTVAQERSFLQDPPFWQDTSISKACALQVAERRFPDHAQWVANSGSADTPGWALYENVVEGTCR